MKHLTVMRPPRASGRCTFLSNLKLLMASLGFAALTGCGGLGSLLSNDRVTDADNDQVVTIGDSIFALSGELQDFRKAMR